ncbi:hypothetical protein B0T10DRAFT_266864 [Thelonectria olida]|uniref:Copper acquisition factor BIM1-like domain-containing protein n=1 Tax=Thelonectria olida TaxID=1576542 RepID=A0A9P8WBA6_9HYPO|nr:hypothetical protein B0T10DRAFT_266864 [Thelonectria olida]
MPSLKSILGGVVALAAHAHAATDYGSEDEMGPAAFMWPADRVWSASMDNTAPCGSVASPGNRSEFPMTNAKIALVAQDDSYDIELSISYLTSMCPPLVSSLVISKLTGLDPKSNSDFSTLIDGDEFKDIDPGHTCVNVPDAISSVKSGDKATLQIKYIADFDSPNNQTFYACADITYVELSEFDESIPCFNSTRSGDDDDSSTTSGSSHGATSTSSSDKDESNSDSSSGKSKSSGLSGGAIAGIVVGSVAGVALIVLAGVFIYRRKSQRLNALRQQHSARGVNWEDQPPKNSRSSAGSVNMNNLQSTNN